MKNKLAAVTLLGLLWHCLVLMAQDVRYNFAAGLDFSKFKTYKWVPIKGAEHINQPVEYQVKAAVDAELSKKGLVKTESDNADLYIGYQSAIGNEKEFNSYSSDWGYGPGWGRGWYGGGMGSTMTTGEASSIYAGQITLDMYDTAAKQLVWRGSASKAINAKAKPEQQQRNIEKSVKKLLANYPPGLNHGTTDDSGREGGRPKNK